MLTGGEAHDFPLAKRLIRVNPPEHLLGDMAYDGDELRERNSNATKPNRSFQTAQTEGTRSASQNASTSFVGA